MVNIAVRENRPGREQYPESRYGFSREFMAPSNFWASCDGVAEAKRRIDAFVESNGRVPIAYELPELGLSSFYNRQRKLGRNLSDIMDMLGHENTPRSWTNYTADDIRLFGLPGHPAPAGFWSSAEGTKEALRRVGEFISESGRAPGNAELQALGIRTFYKGNDFGRKHLRQMMVPLYGRGINAPVGFWKSEEGFEEAKRRLRQFGDENRRAPFEYELAGLGLDYFYKLQRDAGRGIRQVTILSGYAPSLWSGCSEEEIRSFGMPGHKAPSGFWVHDDGIREARRRLNKFLCESSRDMTFNDVIGMGLQAFYYANRLNRKNWRERLMNIARNEPQRRPEIQEPRLTQDAIQFFGIYSIAPYGFWTEKEGWEEALRRIVTFVEETHRLPHENELKVRIGLNGFWNQNVKAEADYREGLKEIFRQAEEILGSVPLSSLVRR